MKKILFAIIACCLAITSAFPQIVKDFKLSEDKTHDERPIDDQQEGEVGRIFAKIMGDPDSQGRTPVQLELENSSSRYKFLLFDRAMSKKQLRKKPNRIVIDPYYGGETSMKVENIKLMNEGVIVVIESYSRYLFPEILVEEGKTYECQIPINLTEPKRGLFSKKKKKMVRPISCTIRISVDTKDELYDKLEHECDSLLADFNDALAREEFCTHKLHRPTFEDQTYKYTSANQKLRDRISRPLREKGWPKDSKRYKRYEALLASLDKMDSKLEGYSHDCGKHNVKRHNCAYCKLSLQQIYNRLNSLYIDLYNGDKQKSAVIKEANALYKCCTDPTCASHAQQWRNGDPYKAGIIEFYEKITRP